MKNLALGSQGLKTSQLGLGCMGMSDFYGTFNDEQSIQVIHRALDLGITFLDTADMYGPFTNEMLVGKAIKGLRNSFTVATKFGFVRDPQNPMKRQVDGKPEYVKSACEASLKRLGIECIDLYYLHRKDPNVPIEETVGAMAELVAEGKVKTIGLSEVSPDTIRKAHQVHPITAIQSEYSLWSREPEDEVFATCKALGVAFVAYSPLGRGFLTGQIKKNDDFAPTDYRRVAPRFQGDNFEKNLNVVRKLEVFAKQKGCTPSQLALAWVLAQGDFIFPIPGTKQLKYLEENAMAANISISDNEIQEIENIFPKDVASGPRYPEQMMKLVNA